MGNSPIPPSPQHAQQSLGQRQPIPAATATTTTTTATTTNVQNNGATSKSPTAQSSTPTTTGAGDSRDPTSASSPPSDATRGLMQTLRSNPYFSAGAGLTALGVGLTLARRGAMTSIQMGTKYLTTSLEIPSKDRSYAWYDIHRHGMLDSFSNCW
jgi:chaperone BCS1